MAECKIASSRLESLQWRAIEASKAVLDIEELRPYQVEALLGIMDGRDVLVAQPTGSGKSVVYQLLPFALDILNVLCDQSLGEEQQVQLVQEIVSKKKTNSIVLVIQPLISLMKDQIKSLEAKGITVCRLMHSSEVVGGQHQKGTNKITAQDLEHASIVLTSPEAALNTHRSILRSPALRGKFVSVAVDESHCFVKW
eukprot:Seg900.3 transcript_id=Seg900.3/GoldUCD/mRNA.D3Y31 product="ATP-dependent helicase SGS1" protein_id=Seg900.3/GoldUCD/D3Y31